MTNLKKLATHVLVCMHKTCREQGARASLKELKRAVKDGRFGRGQVTITKVDCLDQCGRGPVVVVYPDGVWYGGVDEAGARAIVAGHLEENCPARELKILCEMKGGGER